MRAKLLRVHINHADRYQGKPLYEAIVDRCREMQLAGATVICGLEGYGETTRMQKRHLTANEEPVLLMIVDTAENIARLMPVLEGMIHTGVITASDCEVTRVEKPAPSL